MGPMFAGAVYVIAVLIVSSFVAVRIAAEVQASQIVQVPSPVILAASVSVPSAQVKKGTGLPSRIKIPKLRVNASIDHVGLAADGSMGVPKLPRNAAWYMLGPKPGEMGSAVIAGHLNWLYGALGIFKDLSKLKPGDTIIIQDDLGVNTTYIVRRSRIYGQKDDATDVFFSKDGKSHLNLVTCSGIWDRLVKAYTKRLVVFTDKVIE